MVEIGAVRIGAGGAVEPGAFLTFVDPGRPVGGTIERLTGIRDADLVGAPDAVAAAGAFLAWLGDPDQICLVGHNVGFDIAFLERAGLPAGVASLDTAELASILIPTAPSYALQRLAADALIAPEAAHRALHDALTAAAVLAVLRQRASELPAAVLEECAQQASLLGQAYVDFFRDAMRHAWSTAAQGAQGSRSRLTGDGASGVRVREGAGSKEKHEQSEEAQGSPERPSGREPPEPRQDPSAARRVFASDGPLSRSWPGYEERPQQREMAEAIERTMETGGVLVAEAGTGVGKSLAYLVPAIARAGEGERTVVSTYTLPLQDQLVRRDIPALQAALGTDVPVAVLKGRSNYLCPRRWQLFRAAAATREEARLALKTLIWRLASESGDRAEINLMGAESALWSRISADDESCDRRRCGRVAGGCYLERARAAAADAGVVVVNHALLLYDALMRDRLLPRADHVVVDEAHRLEDVAADVFGKRLDEPRLRRDLDRVSRSPLVIAALRGEGQWVERAGALRAELDRARERVADTFGALATPLARSADDERMRVTDGVRAGEDTWLPVELAGERLADALAGVSAAAERLCGLAAPEEEDQRDELSAAAAELAWPRQAIARGIHDPRPGDVVWLTRDVAGGTVGLRVAPAHAGDAIRGSIVERYRSTVMTSATLAVAGSLRFSMERFGVADVAAELLVGSPFDFGRQAALFVPTDIAYPGDDGFGGDVAAAVTEIARALGGSVLVLFTSHSAMRDVAARIEPLHDEGIAVLTQGLDGSRRSIVERFSAGAAVLLGTQSFWEGVDLPGRQLRCVIVAKLPFAVPDDPLVAGRAERYDDPFSEFHLPQAALRLRQGFGRLIRTREDRGAVVLLDRRILERDYGPTFVASLPDVRLRRVRRDELAHAVAEAAR